MGYSNNTNLIEDSDRRVYINSIGFGFQYSPKPWQFGLGTGVSYQATDTEVREGVDNPSMDDIKVSGSRSTYLNARNTMSGGVDVSLPTSENAGYEQYRSIFGFGISLSTRLPPGGLSLKNSLRVGHVSNTYQYSPVNNQVNPEWLASYSLGASYKFNPNWSIGASAGVKSTKYLDSTQEISASQSLSIGFGYSSFSVSAGLVNGSYREDGPDRMWAFNQFRQQIYFGAGYGF